MTYQGVVLPVADLVRRAQARPVHEHPRDTRGGSHSAVHTTQVAPIAATTQ